MNDENEVDTRERCKECVENESKGKEISTRKERLVKRFWSGNHYTNYHCLCVGGIYISFRRDVGKLPNKLREGVSKGRTCL